MGKGALDRSGAAVGQLPELDLLQVVDRNVLVQGDLDLTAARAQRQVETAQDHTEDRQDQNEYDEFPRSHTTTRLR